MIASLGTGGADEVGGDVDDRIDDLVADAGEEEQHCASHIVGVGPGIGAQALEECVLPPASN
jgi:hypothetical protein